MRCVTCGAEMMLMNVDRHDSMAVLGCEHHTLKCSECQDVKWHLAFIRSNRASPPISVPVAPPVVPASTKQDVRPGLFRRSAAAMPSTPVLAAGRRLLAALAVVGTLVEAVLSTTAIAASRHDQWLIHGPLMLLMVVIWFIIWRIECGQRRTNAATPPTAAGQDTVEEIDRLLAAASDSVSATIEETTAAGRDTVEEIDRCLAAASDSVSATIEPTVVVRPDATVEEIGRRLAAMLAEKGILINSPQCELRRRGSDGASATVEAKALAGQYTVEEIVATLAKKGILINSPKCELRRTTNDGANANIEATVVADQDIFEKIGRRLAAMLAEKGILLNSRNRSG